MIVINHFVHRWIVEPELSRKAIFDKVHTELLSRKPKNQAALEAIVTECIHKIQVEDLEEAILDFEDKTEKVSDPLSTESPIPVITIVQEGSHNDFQGVLKEYYKVCSHHGISC